MREPRIFNLYNIMGTWHVRDRGEPDERDVLVREVGPPQSPSPERKEQEPDYKKLCESADEYIIELEKDNTKQRAMVEKLVGALEAVEPYGRYMLPVTVKRTEEALAEARLMMGEK